MITVVHLCSNTEMRRFSQIEIDPLFSTLLFVRDSYHKNQEKFSHDNLCQSHREKSHRLKVLSLLPREM